METKDNVIYLFNHLIEKDRIKAEEIEGMQEALFIIQHSDDDILVNNNEFEFKASSD